MLHRWTGCIVGGRLGGLSSNHSATALSTDQIFLGAKPLRRAAALTGYRGNHLSVATANLAADLHLACEPCILLASLGPATADFAMISTFVFFLRSSNFSGDRRPTLFVKTQIGKWLPF